jgi:hypothetical protein
LLSLATHPFAFPFTDVLNGVIAMDSAEACKKELSITDARIKAIKFVI